MTSSAWPIVMGAGENSAFLIDDAKMPPSSMELDDLVDAPERTRCA